MAYNTTYCTKIRQDYRSGAHSSLVLELVQEQTNSGRGSTQEWLRLSDPNGTDMYDFLLTETDARLIIQVLRSMYEN